MPERKLTLLAVLLTAAVGRAEPGLAQSTTTMSGFVPGHRTIWALNFSNLLPDSLPKGIRLLRGNLEISTKDGAPTLKATSPSEFLVRLPEVLPADFTIEFELAPKACCNPEDLMFEGTAAMNRGPASAQISWTPSGLMVVGGGPVYQGDMPEDLKATTPGTLTQVNVSFQAGTVKLYTNGKRLTTLSARKFVRGKVLRVWLGGQDDGEHAVHLSKLRIATK